MSFNCYRSNYRFIFNPPIPGGRIPEADLAHQGAAALQRGRSGGRLVHRRAHAEGALILSVSWVNSIASFCFLVVKIDCSTLVFQFILRSLISKIKAYCLRFKSVLVRTAGICHSITCLLSQSNILAFRIFLNP